MAITEVFIQVTDVPLSLQAQSVGLAQKARGRGPTEDARPRGGTYLCPPVLQRSGETRRRRKETGDEPARGGSRQKGQVQRWEVGPGAESRPDRVDTEQAPALVWAGRPGHPPLPLRPCARAHTHTHTHTQALLHRRSQPRARTPPTLMRCLLTHLVKVFFCTRSRSSGRDKARLPGPGRSPASPREVTAMQTQWLVPLRITLPPTLQGPR